jgi:hypothetical protein
MSSSKPKNTGPVLAGVVGFFDDPETLLAATAKVRDSQFKDFDCYTPFAVHGLEHAQGLKPSLVPYVTGAAAFTGTACAYLWQYYASYTSWPHIIGGKPFNSIPAFVPIIFELSVLFGGIATFWAMLFFNRLPNLSKRSFDPSITDNRFAIMIENPKGSASQDDEEGAPKVATFSESAAEQFLKSIGAKDVRSVMEQGWFS